MDENKGTDLPELPRRRVVVTLQLGADSMAAASAALEEIGRTGVGLVSGIHAGMESGWVLDVSDAGDEVTHDSYFAALEEYRIRMVPYLRLLRIEEGLDESGGDA